MQQPGTASCYAWLEDQHAESQSLNILSFFPPLWCSKRITFGRYLCKIMTSWALVREKERERVGEGFVCFASECQSQLTLFTPSHTHLQVCDVWFLEPQVRRDGESADEFALRVQRMIADKAQLTIVPW